MSGCHLCKWTGWVFVEERHSGINYEAAVDCVPPRINDWNRFEDWINRISELAHLLDDAGIDPDSAYILNGSHAPERDLNQL